VLLARRAHRFRVDKRGAVRYHTTGVSGASLPCSGVGAFIAVGEVDSQSPFGDVLGIVRHAGLSRPSDQRGSMVSLRSGRVGLGLHGVH
jgi:hypothetical protein